MLYINKPIFIFTFLILPAICLGQSKMICDQTYAGGTCYNTKTTKVKAISQLPVKIQHNVNGYLKQALGSIYDSTHFSHGQIVNLRKNFKHDTAAYRREWVVPKYELHFLIHDMSLGIKNYYLQLNVDEFGQIISSNWPRHSFSNRQELSQFEENEKLALKIASRKKFDTVGYTVALEYNNKLDRLCWCFYFNHELRAMYKSYDCILIDWGDHNVINDSMIREVSTEY